MAGKLLGAGVVLVLGHWGGLWFGMTGSPGLSTWAGVVGLLALLIALVAWLIDRAAGPEDADGRRRVD